MYAHARCDSCCHIEKERIVSHFIQSLVRCAGAHSPASVSVSEPDQGTQHSVARTHTPDRPDAHSPDKGEVHSFLAYNLTLSAIIRFRTVVCGPQRGDNDAPL